MHAWWLVVVVVGSGCGRLAFDPRAGDAAGDGVLARDAAPDPSLVFHLDFEVDVASEPNGHTAACIASCPQRSAARGGTVANFVTASSNCLVIGDDPALRPPVFTLALWMSWTAPADVSMFSRPFMGQSNGTNSWEISALISGNVEVGANSTYAASQLTANEWHHVAGVFDGDNLLRYFDGQMVLGVVGVGPLVYDASDDVYVGCDLNFGALGFFYDGQLDDIRLYNRVLSAQEIAALAAP